MTSCPRRRVPRNTSSATRDVYAAQTRATADGEAQRFTEVAQATPRRPK